MPQGSPRDPELMRILFRVIPIFLAVLAVLFILRGARPSGRASERAPKDGPKEKTAKLVKDPVCGTYVSSRGSLTANRSSETFHFCSQDCLDKFVAS